MVYFFYPGFAVESMALDMLLTLSSILKLYARSAKVDRLYSFAQWQHR
jgi:hypothetical protein